MQQYRRNNAKHEHGRRLYGNVYHTGIGRLCSHTGNHACNDNNLTGGNIQLCLIAILFQRNQPVTNI